MAAPAEGSNADESKTKSSNVHIKSIFDVCITRSPGSSVGIGSGDDKECGGRPIPQLAEARASFATPPRRASRATMGDVAVDIINEREERRKIQLTAQLQRIASGIPGYNQPCFERRPHNRQRNVLTRMEEGATGPLSLLYRSVKEHCKIKVWTRSCKAVRGICTGYIVAYDKHWNLAMYDVDEVYKNPALKRKAWSDRRKQKKKKLRQRTPRDVKPEEASMKVDEAPDDTGDTGVQKLMVDTSTDVMPETTLSEVADVKHVTVQGTAMTTGTAAAAPAAAESGEDKTTTVKEKEDDATVEGQSMRAAENDDDEEEDLESLALKLNKLKEELGEISIKEEHSTETIPVETTSSDVDTNLDINRVPKQEPESESSHSGYVSEAKAEQNEAVLDEKKCLPEITRPLKEELTHEGQHGVSMAAGREPVSDNRQTRDGDGDGDGDDTAESDDGDAIENNSVLKRHVNQLFIRGDNVVMISMVPLQWT